ncbi:MAG: Lrp/AsnC family transcriptional regulator [Ilumatobacteraceae bacterium]
MSDTSNGIDRLDQRDRVMIRALRAHPKGSVAELARSVGVSRNTVYSRLDRLERSGVIVGYGPDINPRAAGLGVLGFVTLEIEQGSHAATMAHLRTVAEILEVHTVTGDGDLLCVVVASSNDHMHDVLQGVTAHPAVTRSRTQLALHSETVRSVADVLAEV